jgi:rhodanese-related sulfurtransferase
VAAEKGFAKVFVMPDGIQGWERSGKKTQKP